MQRLLYFSLLSLYKTILHLLGIINAIKIKILADDIDKA